MVATIVLSFMYIPQKYVHVKNNKKIIIQALTPTGLPGKGDGTSSPRSVKLAIAAAVVQISCIQVIYISDFDTYYNHLQARDCSLGDQNH